MMITAEGDCNREELYRYFGTTPETPTKTAWFKQRAKLKADTLPFLSRNFCSRLPKVLWNDKYELLACDGSAVDVFRNPNDPDTFYEPNQNSSRGYNQIYIVALFSLLDRRYTDLVVQPGRKRNEYVAFCNLVDNNSDGTVKKVFIGDRGFASYNNFAHVIEKKQFFLIRCNDKRLSGILKHPLDEMNTLKEMDTNVDLILTNTQSKKKYQRPKLAAHYRYIYKTSTFDYLNEECCEYDMSLRVVRFQIASGVYENIITNLPILELNYDTIKFLYNLRWKEELGFRDLKHTLCLNAFHSKKYEYTVQEIWARAIMHNCGTAIISSVEIEKKNTKHEYQANFAEAFKICRDFLRLRDSDNSIDVEKLINCNIEPVRPNKAFARVPRFQPPISFVYRH